MASASGTEAMEPMFPGETISQDRFYYDAYDIGVPGNGFIKRWNSSDSVIDATYDDIEKEVNDSTERWWQSKQLPFREAYKDEACAMSITCEIAMALSKGAVGHIDAVNPIYFAGGMSTHLLDRSEHVGLVYEKFANTANPFGRAMEKAWNAVKMYKATDAIQRKIALEMNYQLYVYACGLAEGRRGHRLLPRRRGLHIEQWVRNEIEQKMKEERAEQELFAWVKNENNSKNG